MSMWMRWFLIASLALSGCATTHPGKMGESMTKDSPLPVKISAQAITPKRDDTLELIEITIENTSSEWVRFDKSNLLPREGQEGRVTAVVGGDLKAWAEGLVTKRKSEEFNRALVQLGIMTTAMIVVAAAGGKSSDVRLAGDTAIVGTSVWVLTDEFQKALEVAEHSEKVPETHVFHATTLAPKAFYRRWLLVNKPAGERVKDLVLEFETVEGRKESYALRL